jgi:rSAM/selenodomain-associated transferase 1
MIDSSVRRALIVVAKQPRPGQTKTRLTPPLNGEQASLLYEHFLRDTLDLMRAAAGQIALTPIIAYLPEGGESYFRALAPTFDLLLQAGNDLSERLNNATTHCLTHGFDQVVIMDSDSPTLPADHLVRAFTALDDADVTFGMCDDGGYYCIGLKQPAPPLFLNVTMSTETVARDTLAQAEREGLRVALLPQSYDIDYAADLKRLIDELAALPESIAAHTRRCLNSTLRGVAL